MAMFVGGRGLCLARTCPHGQFHTAKLIVAACPNRSSWVAEMKAEVQCGSRPPKRPVCLFAHSRWLFSLRYRVSHKLSLPIAQIVPKPGALSASLAKAVALAHENVPILPISVRQTSPAAAGLAKRSSWNPYSYRDWCGQTRDSPGDEVFRNRPTQRTRAGPPIPPAVVKDFSRSSVGLSLINGSLLQCRRRLPFTGRFPAVSKGNPVRVPMPGTCRVAGGFQILPRCIFPFTGQFQQPVRWRHRSGPLRKGAGNPGIVAGRPLGTFNEIHGCGQ
jgi:hypothetical protein